ncbi:hypothetical protein AG1IA_06057 [Rhizoctonia solani AG-1 IA]|uniref:Uncharacterized protein n=1 Tax=Thanatephorus cucumeris (strain AG1-IA) TaxID=983506 RepID=L8WSZ0_THACA|nr:hypothetical protein AG1IA_06057 [Rhizoctonia solani AG-1 IA]
MLGRSRLGVGLIHQLLLPVGCLILQFCILTTANRSLVHRERPHRGYYPEDYHTSAPISHTSGIPFPSASKHGYSLDSYASRRDMITQSSTPPSSAPTLPPVRSRPSLEWACAIERQRVRPYPKKPASRETGWSRHGNPSLDGTRSRSHSYSAAHGSSSGRKDEEDGGGSETEPEDDDVHEVFTPPQSLLALERQALVQSFGSAISASSSTNKFTSETQADLDAAMILVASKFIACFRIDSVYDRLALSPFDYITFPTNSYLSYFSKTARRLCRATAVPPHISHSVELIFHQIAWATKVQEVSTLIFKDAKTLYWDVYGFMVPVEVTQIFNWEQKLKSDLYHGWRFSPTTPLLMPETKCQVQFPCKYGSVKVAQSPHVGGRPRGFETCTISLPWTNVLGGATGEEYGPGGSSPGTIREVVLPSQ